MRSQRMKRAVNVGLCGHSVEKYFKMAAVKSERFEVFRCLLEAIQTNESKKNLFREECIVFTIFA